MDKKELLKKIRNSLSKKIRVDKIFLFGSRSRGDYYEDSDYDLAIISKEFENKTFHQRQKIVRPLVREIINESPIETLCYTPEEYKKGTNGFLPQRINEEGISLK